MAVTVGGTAVTALEGTVTVSDRLDERASARATVRGRGWSKGQPIVITEDSVELFAGFVERVVEQEVGGAQVRSILHAVDLDQLADRRIVARGWADVTARTIAQDLVDDYLADEGVVLAAGPDGPIVHEASANYVPVSDVLDALTERAGWWWAIRRDAGQRTLYVLPRDQQTAPFAIAPGDGRMLHGSVQVEVRNPEYRNRQWIRGGRAKTDEQVERFVGDGEQKSFTVGFPVAELPTVTVDAVAETVGVKGIDDDGGKDWLFSYNSATLQRSTAVANGVAVEVTYRGLFSIVAVQQDDVQVTARQTAEGSGSGKVEKVADEPDVSDRVAAFEKAASKLDKFAVVGRRLNFATRSAGLKAGQLLTVTIPEHDLDGVEMLIDQVSVQWVSGIATWDVQAIEGPIEGSWLKFFREVSRRPRVLEFRQNLSEDETIVRLFEFSKTWTEAESPNIFAEFLADGTYTAGDARKAAFPKSLRITHMEALDALGDVLVRRQLTTSTGMETDTIDTTVLLRSLDAAGETIDELVWFGDIGASTAEGSGVEVARETLDAAKTAAEEFQIDRTDTRWAS